MRKFTTLFLVALAVLPMSVFATNPGVYTFDGTDNGSGFTLSANGVNIAPQQGTAEVRTLPITGSTNFGAALTSNSTYVLKPGTVAAPNNACAVDLTDANISTLSNLSLVCKQYFTSTTSTSETKTGIILRAGAVSGYGCRTGYFFRISHSNGSTGSFVLRIYRIDPTIVAPNTSQAVALATSPTYTGYTALSPLYVKCTAVGSTLTAYYSLDGTTWTQAVTTTDGAYTSGIAQVYWGQGSGVQPVVYDDIAITEEVSTGVDNAKSTSDLNISVDGLNVTVNASEFDVFNIQGVKIKSVRSSELINTITLQSGVYMIKSGNLVRKVIVNR